MNQQELKEAIEWLEEDCKYLDKQIRKYESMPGIWALVMKRKLRSSYEYSLRISNIFKTELERKP